MAGRSPLAKNLRSGQAFRLFRAAGSLAVLFSISATAASAQGAAHSSSEPTLSSGPRFTEKTGADIFANVCQGCHMPTGGGAVGAGAYPSIAADKNLEAGGYPTFVVVNGLRAMPPFGGMLNDEQVVAVVNYVRTNFGNDYRDPVTVEDVKTVRQ